MSRFPTRRNVKVRLRPNLPKFLSPGHWRPLLGDSEADCPAMVWLDKAGRPCRNRGMRPRRGMRSLAKRRLICATVAHGTCLGTAAATRAEKQCGATDHEMMCTVDPSGGRHLAQDG